MDWIQEHAWQTWLIAALLLAAAEMATLDLTLLMMAIGAGAGCLMAALGFGIVAQVLVAVAVAVALLAFVRPTIVRRLHAAPTLESGSSGLVGKSGLVLERVTALCQRHQPPALMLERDGHYPSASTLVTELDAIADAAGLARITPL